MSNSKMEVYTTYDSKLHCPLCKSINLKPIKGHTIVTETNLEAYLVNFSCHDCLEDNLHFTLVTDGLNTKINWQIGLV